MSKEQIQTHAKTHIHTHKHTNTHTHTYSHILKHIRTLISHIKKTCVAWGKHDVGRLTHLHTEIEREREKKERERERAKEREVNRGGDEDRILNGGIQTEVHL